MVLNLDELSKFSNEEMLAGSSRSYTLYRLIFILKLEYVIINSNDN